MFKPDFINVMKNNLLEFFLHQVPFHRHIGIGFEFREDDIVLTCPFHEDLVGNSFGRVLHGGVIATLLDACGGINAYAKAIERIGALPSPSKLKRLSKGATIDLRVDYLAPGRGEHFTTTCHVLKAGSRVTMTRMELQNEQGVQIAVGSGTYLIDLRGSGKE